MDAELILLIIHPPVSIACYFFVILNTIYTLSGKKKPKGRTLIRMERSAALAWWLCLIGLITGMIWAEIAWGQYWSWDPKETGMLVLFLSLSAYLVVIDQPKRHRHLRLLSIICLIMVIATLLVSPVFGGFHSHYY